MQLQHLLTCPRSAVSITEFRLHKVMKLGDLGFESVNAPNYMRQNSTTTGQMITYNKLIGDEDFIISELIRKPNSPPSSEGFLRAGPRKLLHFAPEAVNAAIVTCGGLCPGLNNVIREIVHTLHYSYNATTIWGIR